MLSAVARTVLLQHDLSEAGSSTGVGRSGSHFDWMIESPVSDGLITFRVDVRIDWPECVGFRATRLAAHRAIYLEYEGEISQNRGRVVRVASGVAWGVEDAEDRLRAEIDWGMGVRVFTGMSRGGEWGFEVGLP
jgi:hypothetical protein